MKILLVPEPFPGSDSAGSKKEFKSPYGEVQETEIILGGCYRELQFRNGTGEAATVTKERFLIQQVPYNKMDLLAQSWGKPPLEAMLYLGVDGSKTEQLIGNSFDTVIEEGRRLNFTLLQKWLKWQMEAMSATGREDQINQIIEKAILSKLTGDQTSPLPSPK